MARNPYLLPEPCMIAFSGGKTSGYQLRKILDAYGGTLPERVRVVFANTGWERPETFDFIEECSRRWAVPVTWLEYRDRDGKHGYEVVTHATASRNGEPFEQMLRARGRIRERKGLPGVLPNPVQRMCTGELKIKTMARYLQDLWGTKPSEYFVALALRSDEPQRVEAALRRDVEAGKPILPLDDAGVTASDVLEFWQAQPFTLLLASYQGNCRLCYMKKRHALDRLLREDEGEVGWWIEWEKRTGQRFRQDRPSYAGLLHHARHQLRMWDDPADGESVITCEGGYCSD